MLYQGSKPNQFRQFLSGYKSTRIWHKRFVTLMFCSLVLSGVFMYYCLRRPEPSVEERVPTISLKPPISREELGHATWSLIHTMASKFPETPTDTQKTAAQTFLQSLGELYPCGTCGKHFRQLLLEFPPQVQDRDAFMNWACMAHNMVNVRLEKTTFECAIPTLLEYWPDKLRNDCGCSDDPETSSSASATGPVSGTGVVAR